MSLLKKLAGQTVIYGLSSILSRLLSFVILTPYLTYKFERVDFAIQTDLYVWAAFLLVLLTHRMETALFRFGAKAENRNQVFRTAAFSVLFHTSIILASLALLGPSLARWLAYPEFTHYVYLMLGIIGFDALMALPFARLRLAGKAIPFAALKILNLLIYLGALLFFLELGPTLAQSGSLGSAYWFDPNLGIGYLFVANLLANFICFLFLLPQYRFLLQKPKGQPYFDPQLWQKMMRYALPLIFAGFASMINELADRSLLKVLLPGTIEERLAQMGVYSAAYKLAVFMNLFTQAFNYAAEPFFFRQAAAKQDKAIYAQVARLFTLVGALVFVGLVCFMDLIQYFLGQDFREGIGVVPILLMANLFLGLYYNFAIWFKLSDRTQYGAYIAVFGAGITLTLNFLLIPILGYWASAWATLACYFSMSMTAYFLGQKHYPIPYPLQSIFFYIFAALGSVCLFWGLQAYVLPTGPIQYIFSALCCLLFLGLVFLKDRQWLLSIFRPKSA